MNDLALIRVRNIERFRQSNNIEHLYVTLMTRHAKMLNVKRDEPIALALSHLYSTYP